MICVSSFVSGSLFILHKDNKNVLDPRSFLLQSYIIIESAKFYVLHKRYTYMYRHTHCASFKTWLSHGQCMCVCMHACAWVGVCVCVCVRMFVCVCVITLSSVHTFYDYRYIRIYIVPPTLFKFLQKFKDKIFEAQLAINLETIENLKTGVFIFPFCYYSGYFL